MTRTSRALIATLCLVMALSLLPPAAHAAELSPAVSNNITASGYKEGVYEYSNGTVRSHLYENSTGGLTRVEFLYGTIIVEDYDGQFKLRASRTIEMELPIWGGFFAGEQYNFIIFGQTNTQKDDRSEVIRVVKYDKSWKRLGAASMYGANTVMPFDAGSLRCDEYGGYLYIRTSHLMYNGHQANMMLSVREQDMTVTDSFVGNELVSKTGYVSHSFDQYILIDQAHNIVTLDLGDANPRALRFDRYIRKAGQDRFGKDMVEWYQDSDGEWYEQVGFYPWVDSMELVEFPGRKGDNRTGCAVGGLEATSAGYAAAYSYDGYDGTLGSEGDSNVYLAFVDRNLNLKSTRQLSEGVNSAIIQTASTGQNGGWVLWNEAVLANYKYTVTDTLYYVRYDAQGQTGEVRTANAFLSDCRPICWKGKVVWYATNDSGPVFYLLDQNGVERILPDARLRFSDLSPTGYYLGPVSWAVSRNITNGTGDGSTFSPDQTCTHGQILTFLWRAMGYPAAEVQTPFPMRGNEYYFGAARWAYSMGMIGADFNANANCARADAVHYIWQAVGKPTADYDGRFADVSTASPYAPAVAWAVVAGVTQGTGDSTFSPGRTCTRGQIVTFLFRALDMNHLAQVPPMLPGSM